jgi:hypothetical protein
MLATQMIERKKNVFGKDPRQASFDGGFATRANLADINALGAVHFGCARRTSLPRRRVGVMSS